MFFVDGIDFSNKVGHDVDMYIRQTKTSASKSGEHYCTHRLVASERIGSKVRQKTLLNLGALFSLPREQWPHLCSRIEQLLSGQVTLLPLDTKIEPLAQRYAAQIIAQRTEEQLDEESNKILDYQEVDINSVELVRPRSIGVEHVGLSALVELELPRILEEAGLNGAQRSVAMASIIGRMAVPANELATWRWLRERSGLGDLLDMDFEGISSMSLYRVSDLLIKHQELIEKAMFKRISTLFSLSATVTLYDLTNTYFEGDMAGNDKARRGHSKEKRSDRPLVTLGLILDGSGFVRRSRMFAGNAVESRTLEEMLQGLDAPSGALVVMDRGIATEDNIAWLVKHSYRYVVVSRERQRHFDPEKAVELSTAANQTIRLQREVSEDGAEVRLYCHSQEREAKESAMSKQFANRFEQGLNKLVEGLSKPRGEKKHEKIQQRIGRLKAKSHGVSQHYQIEVSTDADGKKVTGITWKQEPCAGSMWTHPGVYCLRSNEVSWDEETLWRTYIMLTDLESVFRSLKSELGMHPIYHHKEERAQGHLFITVLAYQAVQMLRQKLAAKQIRSRWHILRETLSTQQRVTATFQQRDGRTLNVRKATIAEPNLKQLYDALGITATPGGIQKYVN